VLTALGRRDEAAVPPARVIGNNSTSDLLAIATLVLEGEMAAEAEAVYREDLQKNPENGWALMGLRDALRMQGKDATKADRRFRKTWAHADVSPAFTCYCQAGE
jgi:Flp pilus assembly protein TadD